MAAALLVGVGVVTVFTVFGASVSASIEAAVERSFGGDPVVESSGLSGAGLSDQLIDEIRAQPQVEAVAALGVGPVRLDGVDGEVGYADLAGLGRSPTSTCDRGTWLPCAPGSSRSRPTRPRRRDGRSALPWPSRSPTEPPEQLTIAAIYDDRDLGGDVLIPVDVLAAVSA